MISPTDIRKKALRQYPAFLAAVLNRTNFFPLFIKGNKGKATTPLEKLYPALRRLLENAKDQKGFGYTVQLKTVNTRHAGEISMPDDIYFEHVEDYLKFIEKEAEFLAFRSAIQRTRKQIPELLPYLGDQPLLVIKHLNIWESLLLVLHYFQQHPIPDQYARALPIDVPSTFIEEHNKLLEELLDASLPKEAINAKETQFERRFGLKPVEPLLRIRFSNDTTIATLPDDIGLPISSWNQQLIEAEQVFLIADESNFLRFPNHPKSVVILASNEVLDELPRMQLLHQAKLYFWGDISLTAFQQLSNLRQHFTHLTSFLMSEKELDVYAPFVEVDKKKTTVEHLSLRAEERVVLDTLETKEGNWVLLQKHIRQAYLVEAVALVI